VYGVDMTCDACHVHTIHWGSAPTAGSVNYRENASLASHAWRPQGSPLHFSSTNEASPAFFHNGTQTLVDILPNAKLSTLAGQDHGPADEVLTPALVGFFKG
jgi:hypothetical protein